MIVFLLLAALSEAAWFFVEREVMSDSDSMLPGCAMLMGMWLVSLAFWGTALWGAATIVKAVFGL